MSSRVFKAFHNLYRDLLFSPSNALRVLGMLSSRFVFAGPLKVSVDITSRCDMGCVMCAYHSPRAMSPVSRPRDMPVEAFRSLARQLRESGVRIVLLTGNGEPFMHPRIIDCISIAREYGLEVELFTNALHMDPESVQAVCALGVKKILVSLHCSTAHEFMSLRPERQPGDFHRIMSNLFLLDELRRARRQPSLYLIHVISHYNCASIGDLVRAAGILHADKVLLKPLLNVRVRGGDMLALTDADIRYMIEQYPVWARAASMPNNIDAYVRTVAAQYAGRQGGMQQAKARVLSFPRYCYIPWVNAHIDMDGNMVGCVYSTAGAHGNIFDTPVRTLWRGQAYRQLRASKRFCSACSGRAVYPLMR